MRTFVLFEASFPDDSELESERHPETPGGRNVAESLVLGLKNRGYRCSEPKQHSFYGWSFDVDCNGITVWCLLQFPGPWLLLSETRSPLFARLIGQRTHEAHIAVLKALSEAIKGDCRFSSVKWLTKSEYEARNMSSAKADPV